MSIGNIHSSIRNLLSSKAFLQLASLPAIPKKPNTKDVTPGHKAPPLSSWIRQKNNSVQQTLSVILEELSTLYAEGIKFNCSDGKIRTGHPKMCGWIADYKEFGTLFQIYANSCVVCEIPQAMQGDNVSGPPRDFALYEEKSEEYKELKKKLEAGGLRKLVREKALKDAKIMEEWFKRRRAYIGHRALDDGPGLSMKDAWKPDILHTLYEGMAKYLFEWIEDFLHKDKKEVSIQQNRDRRHEFNQLWIGVPRYNDIASPSKPFFELTQKTGKEMRYGIRLLLPVLASVLADPLNDAVELQYREILTCTRYMVDFMLLCHYRKHTPSTLETLRRYLDEFHKRKHVFRRYRAGAQTRKAKEAAQEMTGEKVTGDKLEQLYEETTNFNFVKLHLLQYFAKAIRMYGSLHNWSTETVEMNLGDQKEAYRASNRNQAMAQVLVSISREYSIDVRELNLQALARILVDEGDERNNEFLIELQSTLMLFADAKAKNAAAKVCLDSTMLLQAISF